MTTIHTIDAQEKILGRVASEAAKLLMGKNLPTYAPNIIPDVKVEIINASKTKMTQDKKEKTLHERYSGYPGGLKFRTSQEVIDKKGWKGLYEMAVYGMLPNNKLRSRMMRHLEIID